MKELIFSGWHFMRWLRLGLGLYLLIQTIQHHDWMSGVLSAVFLFQAISNTGCCGANTCYKPTSNTDTHNIQDITFEEIK